MELQHVKTVADGIRAEVAKAIVGQGDALELMLTSLLCGGHVLLEGVPGLGKTLSPKPSPRPCRCGSDASSSRRI